MKDIYINDVKIGIILQCNNKKSHRFVVIELDLNGDDDYYSRVKIIPEDIYNRYKGMTISEKELEGIDWIERYNFKDYNVCDNILKIHTEKFYSFK